MTCAIGPFNIVFIILSFAPIQMHFLTPMSVRYFFALGVRYCPTAAYSKDASRSRVVSSSSPGSHRVCEIVARLSAGKK